MDTFEFSFEKLEVWKKSKSFVSDIYQVSKNFPNDEKFGLTNQVRRAAVSIPTNIAEGVSRISKKDQANFSQISFSSLMEVLSHLYIAQELGYIDSEDLEKLKVKIVPLSKMISGLRKSQVAQLPSP
jgi:four helix bundle protein